MATVAKRFGVTLRDARRSRGWSQERLAERAWVCANTIQKLETARFSPTLGVLVKLANGLGVELAELLRGSEADSSAALRTEGLTDTQRDFVASLVRLLAAENHRVDR